MIELQVQYEMEIPDSTTVPGTLTLRRRSLVHCRHGWRERVSESTYRLVMDSTRLSERAVPAPVSPPVTEGLLHG